MLWLGGVTTNSGGRGAFDNKKMFLLSKVYAGIISNVFQHA